jgi:hypothetical protein
MLQIKIDGGTRIGNVSFYFYIRFGKVQHPLAMVSLFSLPDAAVFAESSGAVCNTSLSVHPTWTIECGCNRR